MVTWKDKNGAEWVCEITVKTLKDIKKRLDIDLMQVDKTIERVITDVCLLCDVLFVIHSSECEKRGISDEDFGTLLAGDAIADATQAFIDAMINFFPSQQRDLLAKISKKRQEVMARILEKTDKEIDNLDVEELVKKME